MNFSDLDIGDGNRYDVVTPNDLLFSETQRFEIQRHANWAATELKDTALVTVSVTWKGFTQRRHYSVPWSGGNGYAVVFPDLGQLGFSQLFATYTEATVALSLDGADLCEGPMRVASRPGRGFDTLTLADMGTACPLAVYWLDRQGTRFAVPASVVSSSVSGKEEGRSPSTSFSTKAGPITLYRGWQVNSVSMTLETAPVVADYSGYLATMGETPFVEVLDHSTATPLLFDEFSVSPHDNAGGGMSRATITLTNVRDLPS